MDAGQWTQHEKWTGFTHVALDEIKTGIAEQNKLLTSILNELRTPRPVTFTLTDQIKADIAKAVVAEIAS